MTAFSGLAARLQTVFAPRATPLTYRTIQTFTAKVSGGAAVGATAVTLGSLGGGLTGVHAGDSFAVGAYRFTVNTLASGGAITAAPISPALSAAMPADAPVTIVRATEQDCAGWVEVLDTSSDLSPQIKQGDARITILADSFVGEPLVGARIVENGKVWTITNKGRDAAGAAWVLQAKG